MGYLSLVQVLFFFEKRESGSMEEAHLFSLVIIMVSMHFFPSFQGERSTYFEEIFIKSLLFPLTDCSSQNPKRGGGIGCVFSSYLFHFFPKGEMKEILCESFLIFFLPLSPSSSPPPKKCSNCEGACSSVCSR